MSHYNDGYDNGLPKAPDPWFNQRIEKGNGIFDRPSFDLMMSHCTKFDTALDIGSHVGTWALGMSEKFKTVHAYEALQSNYRFLLKNIEGKMNIHPKFIAIGDKEKIVQIETGRNSGQAHVGPAGRISEGAVNVVPMTMIDKLIDDSIQVDLIKIDVEGYELPVLKGAKETILRCAPVILVELNGLAERYGYTDADVVNFLETELGYWLAARENKDYIFKKP